MHYFEEIREKAPNEKDDTTIYYLELATGDKIVRRGFEPFDKLDTVYYKDQYGGVSVSFFDADIGRRTCQRIIDKYGEQGNNCFLRNLKGIPPFVREQFSPYQQLQLSRNVYGPQLPEKENLTEEEKIEKREQDFHEYSHNTTIYKYYRNRGWNKDLKLITKDITEYILATNKEEKEQAKSFELKEMASKCFESNFIATLRFTELGLPYPKYLDEEIINYCHKYNRHDLLDNWYTATYENIRFVIPELVNLNLPIPQHFTEKLAEYYTEVHSKKYNPNKIPNYLLKKNWQEKCFFENKSLQRVLARCNYSIPALDNAIEEYENKDLKKDQTQPANPQKIDKLKQFVLNAKKHFLSNNLNQQPNQEIEQEK